MLTALAAALPAIIALLGRFIPDPEKAREAQMELEKMLIAASTAQQQINMKEAEHASMFVAGWRPFVGWVCGFGCAYSFIAQPLLSWFSLLLGGVALPIIDMATLLALLTGMLGLGGIRTYEKIKEVSRENGIKSVIVDKVVKKFSRNKAEEVTQYRD